MAKPLIFKTKEKEFSFEITKLDRKKLYGWKEVTAFDDNGNECLRMELDEMGSFIIPSGGKALGLLDDSGNWVDKSQLVALNQDGTPAQLIPSSFDVPLELDRMASMEDFLDHKIENVYALNSADTCEELVNLVKSAEGIYCFEFNYRADYEGSPSFLVESKGNLYLLVGTFTEFDYIGLEEAAEVSLEEDGEGLGDDELDFNMM